MKIIDKKPMEQPKNVFYGVDVNDKAAVEKEFLRLKEQHRKFTIVVIIVLLILGVIVFDFCRVNLLGGRPIFAVEEKVDKGTLFKGLGYNVLYCNNGERFIGNVLYKSCEEPDMIEFSNMIYKKIIEYGNDSKKILKNELKELNINTLTYDSTNKEGGTDYLANISYQCKKNSVTCFNIGKEFNSTENINVYIKINKYNEVYNIVPFKTSGKYYKTLNTEYTEKAKNYLIENSKLDELNLRDFKVKLIENHGKYKFRNESYADSYLIEVNYLCVDGGNECVYAIDKKDYEGDYSNLVFYATMFVDEENNIKLIGPREYLDL